MSLLFHIFRKASSQHTGSRVNPVFQSEEQLRLYIEHELDYAVRSKHPKLDVMFRDQYAPSIARSSARLWWRINDHSVSGEERFYTLEAYPEREEFVIWFGHVWGRRFPEEGFRPAVHVGFHSYDEFFRDLRALIDSGTEAVPGARARILEPMLAIETNTATPGPLARALEWMLANETNAATYHPTSYPMNRSIY